MSITSLSLLERLKQQPSASDWQRLLAIYQPLIRGWLSRTAGLRGEADDLSQEVLIVVFREIAHFERQRDGSFRRWLRQVTVNRVRTHWRQQSRRPLAGGDGFETEEFLARLEDPSSALAAEWDREHDRHVFARLVALVKPDFQPETWEAFQRFALDGLPARRVAADLNLSENAVLLTKARIMRRLREEAGILLD